MTLSVARALRDGLGRTFERNGLLLVAVFLAVRVASTVAADTLTRANLELVEQLGTTPGGGLVPGLAETPTPFALGLSFLAAGVLALAVALLAEAVRIVAVRTLVSDRVDTVPGEYVRRNLVMATVNGFIGGVVVITLAALGLLLFVVPGVFLAISFFFVRQEIAVRDVNFVEAMSGSWALATGHRIELFGLAVVLVLAWLIGSIPGAVVGAVDPIAGAIVGAVAQAVVAVFGVASVARAYVQLREADTTPAQEIEEEEEDDDDEELTYEGALTADDLPPPDRSR